MDSLEDTGCCATCGSAASASWCSHEHEGWSVEDQGTSSERIAVQNGALNEQPPVRRLAPVERERLALDAQRAAVCDTLRGSTGAVRRGRAVDAAPASDAQIDPVVAADRAGRTGRIKQGEPLAIHRHELEMQRWRLRCSSIYGDQAGT